MNRRNSMSSALAVAFVVLAVSAFAAWLFQARARRARPASICLAFGLMIFPVITTIWPVNLLPLQLSPSAPITLSLFDTNRPATSTGQWLSTEMLLTGVPERQVAVVQSLPLVAHFKGARAGQSIGNPYFSNPTTFGYVRPWNSPAKDDYFHVIQGFFPAATLWFKTGLLFLPLQCHGDQ